MVWRYWRGAFANAARRWWRRFHGGVAAMIGFFVQTAVLFLLLYFQPWFGVVQDEARLAAAAGVAVIVSGALFYVWDLIVAPAEQYHSLRDWTKEIEEAVVECEQIDKAVYAVGDRFGAGMRLVLASAPVAELLEWEREFDAFIKDNFDAEYFLQVCLAAYPAINYTLIQEGESTKTIRTVERYPDDRARIEAKLSNLRTWMGHAGWHYRGRSANGLQNMATRIRLYGLPEHRLPSNTGAKKQP